MVTIKQIIIRIIAEKLREYYMRGIRDARIEFIEGSTPSFLEEFNAGDFNEAFDKNVWLKIAEDIVDIK